MCPYLSVPQRRPGCRQDVSSIALGRGNLPSQPPPPTAGLVVININLAESGRFARASWLRQNLMRSAQRLAISSLKPQKNTLIDTTRALKVVVSVGGNRG